MLVDSETTSKLWISFYYSCLYCFFRVFITASVDALVLFQSLTDPWSEILYYELNIDWKFCLAEFYYVAVTEPWALCIFVAIFTLAIWSSALVTCLDECGCGALGDFFESFFSLLSSSSGDNEDDFADLPDIFGEDDEEAQATKKVNCSFTKRGREETVDDYDRLVYHPTYGVIPIGVFKRWDL